MQGSKLEQEFHVQTLEITVWMCKNVYDSDGNVIGIYDNKKKQSKLSDKNDIIYGAQCKSDEEIADFLANEGEM